MNKLINHNYFETIDTEDKAYFLGFLAADGCIYLKRSRQKYISFGLKTEDGYMVEQFKNFISPRLTISYKKPYQSLMLGKIISSTGAYSVSIRSTKLFDDLYKYNFTVRKSLTLKFPPENSIPDNLIHHFVRGYFDGDGTLCKYKHGRHVNPQFQIMFCGSFDFLSSLNNLLTETIQLNSLKIKTTKSKIYQFSFGGNNQVKSFYNWLYQDATLFLTRKEIKMKEVFQYTPYAKSKGLLVI